MAHLPGIAPLCGLPRHLTCLITGFCSIRGSIDGWHAPVLPGDILSVGVGRARSPSWVAAVGCSLLNHWCFSTLLLWPLHVAHHLCLGLG